MIGIWKGPGLVGAVARTKDKVSTAHVSYQCLGSVYVFITDPDPGKNHIFSKAIPTGTVQNFVGNFFLNQKSR